MEPVGWGETARNYDESLERVERKAMEAHSFGHLLRDGNFGYRP